MHLTMKLADTAVLMPWGPSFSRDWKMLKRTMIPSSVSLQGHTQIIVAKQIPSLDPTKAIKLLSSTESFDTPT